MEIAELPHYLSIDNRMLNNQIIFSLCAKSQDVHEPEKLMKCERSMQGLVVIKSSLKRIDQKLCHYMV